MPWYKFVKLPTSDGDDAKIAVGSLILRKEDLGLEFETKHSLDGNIHFQRIPDIPEQGVELETRKIVVKKVVKPKAPRIKEVPVEKIKEVDDYLGVESGFIMPEKTEEDTTPPEEEKPKTEVKKKRAPKSRKKRAKSTMKSYKVNCYICGKEFTKRSTREIFSFDPSELVCRDCK